MQTEKGANGVGANGNAPAQDGAQTLAEEIFLLVREYFIGTYRAEKDGFVLNLPQGKSYKISVREV